MPDESYFNPAEYYDPEYYDPEDEDDDEGVTCNRCHATGLYWGDRGAGFKLRNEDGSTHVCHAPTQDDFDVVS